MRRVHSCTAVSERMNYENEEISAYKSSSGVLISIPEVRRIKTDPASSAMTEQHIHPQSCKIGVHTDHGGVPFMEDAHQTHVTSEVAVFCVYDGHGGAHAAHYCRDHLHLNVLSALGRVDEPGDALLRAFASTEAGLLAEQQQQAERLLLVATGSTSGAAPCLGDEACSSDCCGATALVALLRDESLHLAWLGDCRAVLCRGGEAVELTSDHVLSGGEDSPGARERVRVLSEGGTIEGGRLGGFLTAAPSSAVAARRSS